MRLAELQDAVEEWSAYNFERTEGGVNALLGIVEEVGELSHAVLKQRQKIRGTFEQHEVAAKDAVGDMLIYLADFANMRGWLLEDILKETWAQVSKRDWKKDPKTGG